MKDEELIEESSWDKKKIIIAVIFLFCAVGSAYAAKKYFLSDENANLLKKVATKSSGVVAGANTQIANKNSEESDNQQSSMPFSPSTLRVGAQKKLDAIKEQIANIKVEDIASSSPQIQKVVNDLKALEQYPKDQAKQMCENICKNL